MRRAVPLLLIACIACAACAPREDSARRAAETPLPIPPRETLRDSAAALAQRLHVPGVAVASIRDGRVLWTLGLGTTRAGGDSVTAGTVFQGASLGKPLFAYGVLKLAAQGRIDPFAPLARYLPERIRGAALDSGVTAARILSHTAGLVPNEAGDRIVLAFRPGEGWKYSGVGYLLLQRAAEHVTGMAVDEWMKAEVFEPLGMTSTSYHVTPPGALATGHARDGGAIPMSPPAEANVAATLYTTADDYAKFVIAAFTAETMFAPRGMVTPEMQLGWGLGWGLAGPPPPAFLQWGSNPGFKSLAMGIPGHRAGFVILTNGDHGLELATALAPMLLGHEYAALEYFMLHPDD